MAQHPWMIEELHKMRALAEQDGLPKSAEMFRVAIIHCALEQGLPTGLGVRDLAKMPDVSLMDFEVR